MTDSTTMMSADPADVEKNKVMAIFAYIIFFLPLLAAKDSPFARFHANQGTWLVIIGVVGNVISTLLTAVVIGACLWPIVNLAWLVYAILGIVNASQGKMQVLPGFGTLPTLFK